MPIHPGTKLGPYEILAPLGAGGMGEVYRARDTRLGRDVAIKVIPEDVAADPERVARFEREARLLASLRHPNLATLHGLETVEGQRFIVMEFVEGVSLAQRLAQGPLPVAEALDACRQIATGLEAAHEGGVIHRDLKPANVMVTPAGEVRVLDFGLARGDVASSSAASDYSHSPTLTGAHTSAGVILGTAAYMSPEQARGRPVDRRTDVWSFGVVLYECLAGRQCFAGETLSDTIAMILQRDPDWDALPRPLPPGVRALLGRCLERDPRKRLRDIGEARIALEASTAALESDAVAEPGAPAAPGPRGRTLAIAGALLVLAGAALGLFAARALRPEGSSSVPVVRFEVDPPPGRTLEIQSFLSATLWDVSPLGDRVAEYVTQAPGAAPQRIWTRLLSEEEWRPVPGSERAVSLPIFFDDSRTVYFLARVSDESNGRRWMRANTEDGSPAVPVCDVPDDANAVWPLSGGRVLFIRAGGLHFAVREPGAGGPPEWKAVDFGAEKGLSIFLPAKRCAALEPDGIFVGTTLYAEDGWHQGTARLDLRTRRLTPVLRDGQWPALLPSGVMVFSRGSSVLAIRYDRSSGRTRGEPVPLLNGIRTRGEWVAGWFRLTDRGDLVYAPGGARGERRSLAWREPQGKWAPFPAAARAYAGAPSSTADGRRVAVAATNPRGFDEVWTFEPGDTIGQRALSAEGADLSRPVLSRDGNWIACIKSGIDGGSEVWVCPFGAEAPPHVVLAIASTDSLPRVHDWFPDGRHLLARITTPGAPGRLVLLEVDPASKILAPPRPLLPGYGVQEAHLSADGRFLAFSADRSGRVQVFACAISPDGTTGAPVMVARTGDNPTWSADGRRIFYNEGPRLHEVQVATAGGLSASADRLIGDVGPEGERIEAGTGLPDGRVLFVLRPLEGPEFSKLEVVQNWVRSVEGKLPR